MLRRIAAAVMAALPVAATVIVGTAPTAVADTSPPAGLPATVSVDALPTVQINGVVWSQTTVGNTVYAAGNFTQSRPSGAAAGTNQTARSNLLAYNITTGALVTAFNHPLNGQGLFATKSPDGSRVYVGGQFTTVDGLTRNRIAAFDTASGTLVSAFAPSLNGTVQAITATNSTVYVGGDFTTAGGQARRYAAAFSASNGALLPWAPTLDSSVTAMVLAPDNSRVVLGGRFTTINGGSFLGIGPVDATTAATTAWNANFPIQDSGSGAAMTSLTADSTQVYGSAYSFGQGGNFEGRFAVNPYTGAVNWLNSCHGDSYDAYPIGQVLYVASHQHDCSDNEDFSQDLNDVFAARHNPGTAESTFPTGTQRAVVFAGGGGVPGPMYSSFPGYQHSAQLDWYPTMSLGTFTGQSQAAWSVTGNASYVSYGGEFPRVNGSAQQGLVRFAVRSLASNATGPNTSTALTPTGVSQTPGTVRVTWRTTSDNDNETLTYRLYRDAGTTAIYTATVNSRYWYLPMGGYVDTPGAGSHTYKVTATDPLGNVRTSGTSAAVTAGTTGPSTYATTVRADGAVNFWPLSEATGTTARDVAGYNDITLGSSVTRGAAGPTQAGTSTASTFDGTENSYSGSVGNGERRSTFSLESWVRTTSTTGGQIAGYDLYQNTASVNVDRVLYLSPAGLPYFGVWANNANNTVNGTTAINNGQWHHVVGTVGASGMTLYVDGTQVATQSGISSASVLSGYWRIGGDVMTGWPTAPPPPADPMPQPGQPPMPTPPTPFALAGSIADVAVYPTALSAAKVQSHFGATPPGNQAPTAAFTPTCSGLACSFNGSASTDPDGTISSYSWNFGDNTAAGTGATVNHTYPAAGTYTVTLTVTDNGGATGTSTQQVTVTAAAALADDTFNRTVSGGWGTATSGGPWTISSGAANFSVTPGAGTVNLPTAGAGSGTAYLGNVSARDVDVTANVAIDKIGLGNGTSTYLVARRTSSTSQYRAKVRVPSTGSVVLSLTKLDGSASEVYLTGAAETAIAGLTYTPGAVLHVRLQTVGTSPTTVRARVWLDGTTEPTTWQVSATDTGGAALQGAGTPGFYAYASSGATNVPIKVTVSRFTVSSL